MKHWTNVGAYVASFFLAVIGAVGLACGPAWPSVVVAGLSVALTLGLVALEAVAAAKVADEVVRRLGALEALQAERDKALDKAGKDAEAALAATVRITTSRPARTQDY